MINNNLSDYLVKSKYGKVLQTALYQQNYVVLFEFEKGGVQPPNPPPGCATDCLYIFQIILEFSNYFKLFGVVLFLMVFLDPFLSLFDVPNKNYHINYIPFFSAYANI